MIRVIHIRDSKGTKDEVYIGRPGKGRDGYLGNPVVRGRKCPVCEAIHKDPGDTLNCYSKYAAGRVKTDPKFRRRVFNLKNKTLVCFCKPKPCHGDILAALAEVIQPESLDESI